MSLHAGSNAGGSGSSVGTATVFGPASSTLNAAAIWGNTTGTVLADSRVIVTAPAGTATATITIPANVTATFFAASDTVAGLGTTQTFTKQNTFAAGSIVTSQPLTVTQNWSASGIPFTGFLVNATDTASATTSLLVDYQIGGASKFAVRKDGAILFVGGGNSGVMDAVGGTLRFSSTGTNFTVTGTDNVARANLGLGGAQLVSGAQLNWSVNAAGPAGVSVDLVLRRRAAASLNLGDTDTATPVAQTLGVQGSRSGTDTNAGGANFTIQSGDGTGTGTASQLILQSPLGTASGSTAQAFATGLTVVSGGAVVGNAALTTAAVDGFLYIPTCAGTPTGTPTTFTGRVALIYDTTAHQFWIYDGGWKQPKTPAGAAIVTWQ